MDENGSRLHAFPKLENVLEPIFTPVGFEAHPFHIDWYNELVDPKFRLDYPPNTLALVLLSGPDTFEKCILPYIQTQMNRLADFSSIDPLDESMKCVFAAAKQELMNGGFDVDMFHDFDLYPNRRPKVLVQTAAHVSGAVEYFHKDRLINKPISLKDSKLFGVAIHPEFGGWFAIRGVIVLKNIVLELENSLPKPPRPFIANDEDAIGHLLEEFTLRWRNNVWRDVLPRSSTRKYSEDFNRYLETEPGERWEFLKNNFFC